MPEKSNNYTFSSLNAHEFVVVNETTKDLLEGTCNSVFKSAAHFKKTTPNHPIYSYVNNTGTVSLDNVIYKDKIPEKEFIELLFVFFNSRLLLSSENLSTEQIRHKRVLLAFLAGLNWGISSAYTQARLIPAIQERIDQTNIIQNESS